MNESTDHCAGSYYYISFSVRCLRLLSPAVGRPVRSAGFQLLPRRGMVTRHLVVSSTCLSPAFSTKAEAYSSSDAEVVSMQLLATALLK